MSRLSGNAILLLLNNIGSAILSFVLSVMIGRALGETGLGIYATALSWVFPLSLLADFGIGTLLTREVAREPHPVHDYLRAATLARLGLGGALTLALVLLAPLLSNNPQVVTGLQISAPLILILPLFGNFTAVFRAQQRMWPIPWLNIGMLVTQVVLTAWVLALGGNVITAFIVNSVTSAIQLLAAWCVWRRWFSNKAGGHNGVVSLPIGILMRAAWPFAVAGVLAAIQARMGIVFLERVADTATVGQYAAAVRFAEAGRMIPNAVFGAVFPLLVVNQPNDLQQTFKRLIGGILSYSLLLGIGGLFLAPNIMTATFGSQFTSVGPVLQIAMWSLLPSLLRAGATLYWYALGDEQFVNRLSGISLLIQLVLNFVMIPRYGAMGAVGVTIVVDVFVLLGMMWRSRKAGYANPQTTQPAN